MSDNLNIQLTSELRRYVDERAGDATPSKYVCDLIRRDMDEREVMRHIMSGLDDYKNGRFSDKSFTDFKSST